MNALLGGGYNYGHQTYEDEGEAMTRAVSLVLDDSDAMQGIIDDIATDMEPDEVAFRLKVISDASQMLGWLLKKDMTVSQLFEEQKAFPERIQALRDLLTLVEETAQTITDRVSERAKELTEGGR